MSSESTAATDPIVIADTHKPQSSREVTEEGLALIDEYEGIRTLKVIIFGILVGAVAAGVLANSLIAWWL